MKIQRIDHIGIIVNDLPAAKAFFLALGLQIVGEDTVEGELVQRVTELQGAKSDIVMMGIPGGGTNIELARFHSPEELK